MTTATRERSNMRDGSTGMGAKRANEQRQAGQLCSETPIAQGLEQQKAETRQVVEVHAKPKQVVVSSGKPLLAASNTPTPPAPRKTLSADPIAQAAILMGAWGASIESDVDLFDDLQQQCGEVANGKMELVERMLLCQATALQTVFVKLMNDAGKRPSLKEQDQIVRLAMKAQSQSRTTLEALIEMKSPRPFAFVRQANIAAGGPQQVNNGVSPAASPRAAPNTQTAQNELLPEQERHSGAVD